MKKIIQTALLLLAFLLPATALAHDFEVGGIYYKINGDDVEVTYKGTQYNQYTNEYAGHVTIPQTVTYNETTYSVTSIGWDAFEFCTALTGVTIPNSITHIGAWAFRGCTGLTSVTIPNSVTRIDGSVFYECSALSTINIPNSVTSIGPSAFRGTAWLDNKPDGLIYAGLVAYTYKGTMPSGTRITLQSGTLGIADYAFENCTNLSSVTIPNTVINIGQRAFYNCSSLSSMYIPNSVTSIGDYTFYICKALASVTLGNSVTSIGKYAFLGCSALTNITIPNSVTNIDESAFSGCSG